MFEQTLLLEIKLHNSSEWRHELRERTSFRYNFIITFVVIRRGTKTRFVGRRLNFCRSKKIPGIQGGRFYIFFNFEKRLKHWTNRNKEETGWPEAWPRPDVPHLLRSAIWYARNRISSQFNRQLKTWILICRDSSAMQTAQTNRTLRETPTKARPISKWKSFFPRKAIPTHCFAQIQTDTIINRVSSYENKNRQKRQRERESERERIGEALRSV